MNGLLLKEKVFDLLRLKGPQLPVHIATQLTMNSTFAGAFLSELIADGKVKYTTLKVGGSPLYYVPGQEERLQAYSKHLGQREKEAYELLAKEQIQKDEELPPVLRVAMRSITDFAVPLRVTTEHESTIYWKWYLVPDAEMHLLLEKKLGVKKEEQKEEHIVPDLETEKLQQTQQTSLLQIPTGKKRRLKQDERKNNDVPTPPPQKHDPLVLPDILERKDLKQNLFVDELFAYFAKKEIHVLSYGVQKKNTDVECVVTIPTPLGELTYFCVAKNKKRCSDAEISAGYVKAGAKGLPLLFLSPTELPKKVHDFVATHMPQALVRTIEKARETI